MSYTGCCGLGNGMVPITMLSPSVVQGLLQPKICVDSSGNIEVPCDYPGARPTWVETETETAALPEGPRREGDVGPPGNLLTWAAIIGGSILAVGGGVYFVMKRKGR